MIDTRNLQAPRTQKDAFERYIQRDVRREFGRQRMIDILSMVASVLTAFVLAGAIGILVGWNG